MELRHLRYFVAVAEELNFSRAAGRVYMSQPALSQQIRKLEEEIGITLFHRTKRQVELTEAGKVLLSGARQALVQVEQSVRAAREVGGAGDSRLKVGFPEYANHTPVADILQTYRRRYPYVELEEYEMFTLQQTWQQVTELRDGNLDLAFLLAPVYEDEGLECERVLRIEMVAALPEGHPLAVRPVVPVSALADERLLLFSRHFHPGCYDYIVGCCREAGFEPDVVQKREPQLYSGSTTYRMVASGLGISIVAYPLVHDARPSGIVFRSLEGPRPMLDLVVVWRRDDLSANPGAFLEVVREFAPAEIRTDAPAESQVAGV